MRSSYVTAGIEGINVAKLDVALYGRMDFVTSKQLE
jgi:hypothetical protein